MPADNVSPLIAPPSRRGLRLTLILCGVALVGVVLAVTLWPTPVDQGSRRLIAEFIALLHRAGVPEWFGYSQLEVLANVLMFVPLGVLGGLLVRPRRLWWVFLALPVLSVCVELTQFWLLPARFATLSDVIANTTGGWIGLAAALALRRAVARRRRSVTGEAPSPALESPHTR
ncbi:hypothetical protein FM113_13240 [Leucobacter sp. 7(1)]|uniref:VanZ family protein n=1 Tax=Leucobacter sp. 7(1) TaxID=1255613 RepID=UPI00097EDAF8|nr:VanZ family protein [Leucobacter sp. 7(1)]SJN11860.1 hypothetical protein FM113_13240 [Leucobacter sp. 7(1)]